MKFSTAFLALATIGSVAAKTVSSKTAAKLVRSARRIEDAEEEEEDEFAFLGNYNVKMVGCKQTLDTPIMNEDGEYEYSAVLLRLCPSAGGCDSDTVEGCKNGSGEMLVGLSTFVEAYFEDQNKQQEENGNDGEEEDEFDVDKYAKCEEYNPDENADDGNQGAWENYAFYVGPTCTEDGLGLKLALFSDETCQTASETSFDTISNGWTLPFATGGLVSTNCNSCTETNDDGEAEIKEMCQKSYEDAALKCETNMEYYSYYGQNVAGCESIAEMFPAKSSNGGKIFGWVVLAVCVAGLGGYVMWWRKKKATTIE
uniref:Uncharacterized protein n=1 Tax=Pseudo-nitzschia australis TaxID=44445 RepID=A0A7S4EJZ6_9STRA|mmetsp:Transcript_24081/g.50814  ORF Transcript_24081/g.50814 Transcript_24081/m.50814 type:complete len:313 (-) Transcript_24081:315-1253(-)|eukprot:CAMPEP_0168173680 /NCGR_PEP_ID=MMETSP0139_2-20121125/6044_1 /TAXON_ID=44445 /ORGANISM="Pseudo-nitzschia australis, Strain 10249 10 AB" /LENGTH=312 /DNA_ID=CAMNT_0008091669 /DNA_START=31 /DNA_END=969 /DNA_ORIENTATION=-